MGKRYVALVNVEDEKLNGIMDRLHKATEEIRECYRELDEMNRTFVIKEAASWQADGSEG